MIKFTLKINKAAIKRRATPVVQRTIKSTLKKIADRIRMLMRLPKTGRQYMDHRASAPGEAPAIRTGRLIGSIGEPVISGLKGALKISAPYAAFLEEGTATIKPRPFAEVAARGVLSDLKREFGSRRTI